MAVRPPRQGEFEPSDMPGGLKKAAAWARTGWPMVSVILGVSLVQAEDVVTVRTEKGRLNKSGTIVDYTGEQLVLRTTDGNRLPISTASILDLQTTYAPQHLTADSFFKKHHYQQALDAYRQAQQDDKRIWMRRRIVAQQVWCLRALGQWDRAGDTFLLIVQSDPSTQFFDAIPLAWRTTEPAAALRQRAQKWLEDEKLPAARLLGASWMLPTERRGDAAAVLRQLRSHEDSRIAFLARAQLWRTEIATATVEEIHRWREQAQRIPARTGQASYFVIGQAYLRHQQYEQAALALLRIPILLPGDRDLAGESLLLAAGALKRIGRKDNASGLYREVMQTYPGTAQASLARSRLTEMNEQE